MSSVNNSVFINKTVFQTLSDFWIEIPTFKREKSRYKFYFISLYSLESRLQTWKALEWDNTWLTQWVVEVKRKRRRHTERPIIIMMWHRKSLPSQKSSQTLHFFQQNSHGSKMYELKPKQHNYLAPFQPEVTRAILIFSGYVIMIVIMQSNQGKHVLKC